MNELRLRHVAAINPLIPGWESIPEDELLTFLPLEAVWPGALDFTRLKPKAEVSTGYTRFLEGDVIVPKITPTFEADRSTVVSGLPTRVGAGTTELHVIRPSASIDARYVNYLVSTRPFLQGGEAEMIGVAGQKRVPDTWLRNCPVPVVSIEPQRVIADFLDRETARIDALITAKRRMIELLGVAMSAFRKHAVLGSVNPFSGDGSPSTAQPCANLGTLIALQRGHDLPTEVRRTGEIPVVSSGGVSGWHDTAACDPPGVVTGRYGTIGEVFFVDKPFWPLNTTLYVRDFRGNDPRWVFHLLRALPLDFDAEKSAVTGINRNVIGYLRVPVPRPDEQREIAVRVDRYADRVNALNERLTAQIDLLVEHRQALITAAVTGELDIQGVAA